MGLYSSLKTLILPLNIHKSRITSAFGLTGGQTTSGSGNEGIDLTAWINERIATGDINVADIAGGYTTVQGNGTPVTSRDTINFSGPGVSVADVGGETVVTISSGSSYTDEMAQDAVGAMVTDGSLVYVDATPLLTRGALTGEVTAPQGSNTTTIAANAVTNTKLADMPANTVKVRNAATSGDPVDMVVPVSTMVGRGSSGDIVPITLGANLSMSAGGVLSASGGGSSITAVTVGSARFSYITLTGTPVVTSFAKSAGTAIMVVTGGTIKLLEVTDSLQLADLSGNSIRYDFVGTGGNVLDAYPVTIKNTVSSATPSVTNIADVSNNQDTDNTPIVRYGNFITAGQGSMSVRIDNVSSETIVRFSWGLK